MTNMDKIIVWKAKNNFYFASVSKISGEKNGENVDIFRLKQLDNQKARIASDLLEMDNPMARSVDVEVYFYDFLKLHYFWIIAHTLCTKINIHEWRNDV